MREEEGIFLGLKFKTDEAILASLCQKQSIHFVAARTRAERDFDAMNPAELRQAPLDLGVSQKSVRIAELQAPCKRAPGAAAKYTCEEAELVTVATVVESACRVSPAPCPQPYYL